MKKIAIALLVLILLGIMIPAGFSSESDYVTVIYGEITENNPEYKDYVNEYFTQNANINTQNSNNKVITQKNVDDMLGSEVNESYLYGHISSAVLLDLNGLKDLKVIVDSSKITSVSPEMYESALRSAGITKGIVYLTSPFEVTGDVELAGMLDAYESLTNIEIPASVKKAANMEIFTQAEIVENSNVSAENVTGLVSVCKKNMEGENVTPEAIERIIDNYTGENNLTISNHYKSKLANALFSVHSVQSDVELYKMRLTSVLEASTISQYSLYNIFS